MPHTGAVWNQAGRIEFGDQAPLYFTVEDGNVRVFERHPDLERDHRAADARNGGPTMKRAAVRLGRMYAGETEIPEGRLYYGHRMKLASWQKTPLLVDHDEGRRIGRVLELYTFKETNGDWLTASCELYPDAPAWIKQGTPASFRSICLDESSFVENTSMARMCRRSRCCSRTDRPSLRRA